MLRLAARSVSQPSARRASTMHRADPQTLPPSRLPYKPDVVHHWVSFPIEGADFAARDCSM